MSFKKHNIKKGSNVFSNIIGVLAICIIVVIAIIVLKHMKIFIFNIGANSNQIDDIVYGEGEEIDQLKEKQNANKINILLVGRGGGFHDAPDLTDTIILASLDKKKNLISMLSLPRDLYVEYDEVESGKLNGIYAKNYYATKSKEKGMNALSKKVSQITGEKVDYFLNVDFNGFTKVIDALGGIEIHIPKNFVDDKYPDNNWGYKTLVFRKGTWNFSGDNALKYARSRHSTSDFDRSLRQQQVISGIKKRIVEADYLTSPSQLKEFYSLYNKYVFTDIGLTDLLDFYPVLKEFKKYKMLSYNINDSCFYGSNTCEKGGFLYIPERSLYGGMSVLLLDGTDKEALNKYGIFQKYSNQIYNHQEFFIENAKVNVFNSLKVNNLAGILSNEIVRYGFHMPKYNSIGNTPQLYQNSTIYYNNISENSETIKYLKTFFQGEMIKTDFPKYSKQEDTKIEIIIGEDYLENNNVFQF
ncbi:MAG: LCP family protein [Candidatus Gracilibacteria bacterium]|nr:LCP family protein [Candidatus Gracilibacteria bacterium]